jgi:uncharacterized protein YegP (UPF0339 family)
MERRYFARLSAKNGRKLYEGEAYPTREEAISAIWKAKPLSKKYSTAIAVWVENLQTWKSYGNDVRWHHRTVEKETS